MRVLVTGGFGFIGHHLVKRLIADRHEVFIIDNLSAPGSVGRKAEIVNLPGYTVYYGMFLHELDTYNLTTVDAIFHLAAVSRTVPAITDPALCFATNVMGSVSVLELARTLKVPRVVMSSSNVVYAADTPYKASKLMMEEAAKAYHETYGLSVICLRYSNVYGPGMAKGDAACFAALRDSYTDRQYIEITGDGNQSRDFTHVSDIVEGNIRAAESDYCGTLDLCTGKNWTMKNAGYYLLLRNPNVMPGLYENHVRYVPDRPGDIKHIKQDPGPAREILGWETRVGLEDGIKDVWSY